MLESDNAYLQSKIKKKNNKIENLYEKISKKDETIQDLLSKLDDGVDRTFRAKLSMHKNSLRASHEYSRYSSMLDKNTSFKGAQITQKANAFTQTDLIPKTNAFKVKKKCSHTKERSVIINSGADLLNKSENLKHGCYNDLNIKQIESLIKINNGLELKSLSGYEESSKNISYTEEDIRSENLIERKPEIQLENIEDKLEKETQTEKKFEICIDIDFININTNKEIKEFKLYQSFTESEKEDENLLQNKSIEDNLFEDIKGSDSIEIVESLNLFHESPIKTLNPKLINISDKDNSYEKAINSHFIEECIKEDQPKENIEFNEIYYSNNNHSTISKIDDANNQAPIPSKEKSNKKQQLNDYETLLAKKKEQSEMLDNKIKQKIKELESLSKLFEEKHAKLDRLASITIEKINFDEGVGKNNALLIKQESAESTNNLDQIPLTKRFSIAIPNTEKFDEDDKDYILPRSITEYLETPTNKISTNTKKFVFSNTSFKKNNSSRIDNNENSIYSEIGEESMSDFSNNESRNEGIAKDRKEHKKFHARKNSNVTEITEFNFTQRNYSKDIIIKKNPSKNILAKLKMKKITWIKRKATMSRKMINKLMSSLYSSYYSKFDYSDGLLDFVYDEFSKKFGFNKVINKKFIDFISSMIVFSSCRRCKVFLRFIRSGNLINEKDYSDESLKFYVTSLNFMITSKIGIASIDDSLDKIMVPFSRVIECIKDKFDCIDKTILNKIVLVLEKCIVSDPNKMNSNGMIENELFLEVLLEKFEELRNDIIIGLELLINSIKYNEDKSNLLKYEVTIMAKWLYPLKCAEIEQIFSDKDVIKTEDFFHFCINKMIFSINDIQVVLPDKKKSIIEIEDEFIESYQNICDIAQEIKSPGSSICYNSFWTAKLNNLMEGFSSRDSYESLIALATYSKEILKNKSML